MTKADPQVLKWYREQKEKDFCVKCNIQHPAVIEYHHRNPREKTDTISNLVHTGAPFYMILEEMKKCDPICRNCHALEHWNENKGHVTQFGSRMSGAQGERLRPAA